LLENVKNIKATNDGQDFKAIIEHLEARGYHVRHEILGAHTHANIPQCRERIFLVGFLDENKAARFKFPKPTPLTTKVDDLVDRKSKSPDKYYYTPESQYYEMMDRAMTNDGVYQMRRTYMRENKNGVCPTLTANMGGGGHNVPVIRDNFGIRKLTPRECLRLQGFPEDFEIVVSDANTYHQAGNAVVVPLVKRIAEQIKKELC
jgi:DNA (cytosine-5)-methyltransferase 1